MNYEEFKGTLKELLQEKLGSDARVEYTNKLKNNHTVKEGIVISAPGSVDEVVFYPAELYEQFQKKDEAEACVEELYKIFQNMKCLVPEINLTCWESVKPRIRACLIQKSWNEEYLQKLCYTEYLDLAIVYQVVLEENWKDSRSFLITLEMLEQWEVETKEVHSVAMKNLKEEEVIVQDMGELFSEESEELELGAWYIFKSRRYRNGAAAMLRKDVIKKLAEERGVDIYILPSSVHDLILLGNTEDRSVEDLKEMVCDINRDSRVINPEDRLSDSVYLYQRERDEIKIAT